jgi:hypothetical protein
MFHRLQQQEGTDATQDKGERAKLMELRRQDDEKRSAAIVVCCRMRTFSSHSESV